MIPKAYADDQAEGYVVEFFMPKRLNYSGATYTELRHQLEDTARGLSSPPCIYGFSLYEVDGAFINDNAEIMEDRTLVIRVFFDKRDLAVPIRRERLQACPQEFWEGASMRIVSRVFSDGSRQIYITDNDGQNIKYIQEPPPNSMRRIIASIEAIYNDADRDAVQGALHDLEQRLPAPASVAS